MNGENTSGLLMTALSIVCAVMVWIVVRRAMVRAEWPRSRQTLVMNRVLVVVIAWFIVIGALGFAGVFRNLTSFPPRPVVIIVVALAGSVFLASTKAARELMIAIPISWLIYMQSFRIVVELILWLMFQQGLIPVQMTFEGYNMDVWSGLLAIPAGWLVTHYPAKARLVGLVYNCIGLVLLTNILIIAVLSMPTPMRYFMNEPANTIIGEFPFIYLPGVLVVLAIFLHVFSLKQIVVKK